MSTKIAGRSDRDYIVETGSRFRDLPERLLAQLFFGRYPFIMMPVTPSDLQSLTRWFHSFEFDDGSQIFGEKSLARLKAEADVVFSVPVEGKSVLDICAWDGYFSFDAERRGASFVSAIDHFCWSGPGWGTRTGFDLVHKKLNSRVVATDVDLFQITAERFGHFDIVLFLGTLYHLTDPLSALRLVASVTSGVAIIETHVDLLNVNEPSMRFYSRGELNNDPTIFWGPNIACLRAMLQDVGFSRIEFHPIGELFPTQVSTRIVAHAWRR